MNDLLKAFNDLPETDRAELISGLSSLPLSLTAIVKATRAAKRGEYAKATFWAIVWFGVGNNVNQGLIARRLKGLDNRRSGVSL